MNGYEKPIVVETEEMSEGVYANSGYTPQGTVDIRWTNHNSGSHSDLHIDVKTGDAPGEYIMVTATFVGNGNITQWGGFSGGYTNVTTSGNTITFVRQGHFNPNENFTFGFDNVVFDGNGDDHSTEEHAGSYYEGQGKGYLGSAVAKGDFVVNLTLS